MRARGTPLNVSHAILLCTLYHVSGFFSVVCTTLTPLLFYYFVTVHILFGTFNKSTATAAEAELSHSFQTAFANFAKDPVNASPAPNWPAYEPELLGTTVPPTLAKIAYHGNVNMDDFIDLVEPDSTVSMRNVYCLKHIYSPAVAPMNKQDGPCSLWDQFLDFRP
jgi:hypothetical protein